MNAYSFLKSLRSKFFSEDKGLAASEHGSGRKTRKGEHVKSEHGANELEEQHREEGKFKPVVPRAPKNVAAAKVRKTSDSANVKLKEKNPMNESFVVKDASGKQVAVKYSESEAKKHADELSKKTGKKHTASFSREASVKRPVKEETDQLDEAMRANPPKKVGFNDIVVRKHESGKHEVVRKGGAYIHLKKGELLSKRDMDDMTSNRAKFHLEEDKQVDEASILHTALDKRVGMSEDAEQLDEISQKTASQYMKGAMRDTIGGKKDRNEGIKRAMARISGTNKPLMRAPVKEEAEVLNVAQTYKKIANKHLKDSTSKTTTAAQKAYAKKMLTRALEASKMDNHKDALNHYRGTSLREAAKWRRDDLEGKTWRAANWDDGDLSPGKINIDRSGKDVDDSGDELKSRPGAWRGKSDMAKRMTKKGKPTKSELAFQGNLKMRIKNQRKDGGLSGPKGKLPESVEHLDELNRSTVSSYKEKASNEVKQMKPYAKGEYSGIVKRVMDRRKRGIAVASKRLGEEKTSSEEPTSPSLAARTLERSIKKSKDPAKSQNTKSSDDKFQSEPVLSSQIMKEHK